MSRKIWCCAIPLEIRCLCSQIQQNKHGWWKRLHLRKYGSFFNQAVRFRDQNSGRLRGDQVNSFFQYEATWCCGRPCHHRSTFAMCLTVSSMVELKFAIFKNNVFQLQVVLRIPEGSIASWNVCGIPLAYCPAHLLQQTGNQKVCYRWHRYFASAVRINMQARNTTLLYHDVLFIPIRETFTLFVAW